MTIDERIEALTHTVELLAQMHQDNERRYEQMFAQHSERIAHMEELAGTLAHLVTNYDQRLRKLEGQ
jgi:hypothetical protein